MSSAPLLVADVPWLLYRAFFGLPRSIVGRDGQPVNALLGTVNALLAAVDATAPRAVVACLGAEQAQYRVELYAPYHAHREPMPAELRAQWERAPELLASLAWVVAGSEQFEADDVMFSFARAEAQAGGRTLLLSGDRDMFQAVDAHTAILEAPKGQPTAGYVELEPDEVRARYGVDPELVPDFIALRGDPSDGLPGAPGIGAKTAAELLRAHGSLDGAIAAAASAAGGLRPRTAAALREHAELLRTFKDIATLVRIDVQRPADRQTDYAAGAQAAAALGMQRLHARLRSLADSAG